MSVWLAGLWREGRKEGDTSWPHASWFERTLDISTSTSTSPHLTAALVWVHSSFHQLENKYTSGGTATSDTGPHDQRGLTDTAPVLLLPVRMRAGCHIYSVLIQGAGGNRQRQWCLRHARTARTLRKLSKNNKQLTGNDRQPYDYAQTPFLSLSNNFHQPLYEIRSMTTNVLCEWVRFHSSLRHSKLSYSTKHIRKQ